MSDLDDLFAHLSTLSSSPTPPRSAITHAPIGWLYEFWRDAWGMDVEEQPHAEMAHFIESALGDCRFDGDTQTLIMLGVPRGSFKTTGASEATPVAVLTRNPNAKILLDGFRHSVAKARLRAIRRKLEQDDRLDDAYGTKSWKPEFRSDTWNDEEIIITPRTDTMSREASIATAGVDRSMNSQHFDLIVADDLVTDTNVQTPEGRERVYQHILDLLPILNPGGTLILVFTTWHPDDAYMRLMKIDDDRVRRGLAPKFKKLIRGCFDGPNGLYFPKRQSYEFLEEQREAMGSRKFSAQYLLKPIADDDKTFNLERMRVREFIYLTTSGRPFGGVIRDLSNGEQFDVETAISWDPAGRKVTRTSDSHGIVVNCTDRLDRWWVPEAIGYKAQPSAVIDYMISLILRYRPWTVSVEDTFGSGLWIDMLAAECARRNVAVSFTEFSTGGIPKSERIALLQPRWEKADGAGGVILLGNNEGLPVHTEFVRQIDQFSPAARLDHEDIIDSWVQHLRIARMPDAFSQTESEANPEDAAWVARQKRLREEAGSASTAGLFGPVWTP